MPAPSLPTAPVKAPGLLTIFPSTARQSVVSLGNDSTTPFVSGLVTADQMMAEDRGRKEKFWFQLQNGPNGSRQYVVTRLDENAGWDAKFSLMQMPVPNPKSLPPFYVGPWNAKDALNDYVMRVVIAPGYPLTQKGWIRKPQHLQMSAEDVFRLDTLYQDPNTGFWQSNVIRTDKLRKWTMNLLIHNKPSAT